MNSQTDAEFLAEVKRALVAQLKAGDGQLQKDIARKLKLSDSRISEILDCDRNITLKTLHKVCTAIGVKPEVVLTPE